MSVMKKISVAYVIVIVASGVTAAQQSPSFKIEEHAFNAAGNPADGITLASTSYGISLDSLGQGLVARGLRGLSLSVDGGFGSPYAPPGEVSGLRFTDGQTLRWDAESTAGSYNLYRDTVSNLGGLGFGACNQTGLTGTSASVAAEPPSMDGFFYLVTAENRIREEGTKGRQGDGTPRGGSVCP